MSQLGMRVSTAQVSKRLSMVASAGLGQDQRRSCMDMALRYAAVFSPDEGVLFETRDQAASPSRDYYQVKVGKNKVALVRWRISNALSNANAAPDEESYTFEEFIHEAKFHEKIVKVFGQDTLDHVERIVLGEWDFLPRLPAACLQRISLMLGLKDLISLSLTCKKLMKLCSADQLWEILYKRHSKQATTVDDVKVVKKIGWKRIFFINNKDLMDSVMKGGRQKTSASQRSKDQKSGSKQKSDPKTKSGTSGIDQEELDDRKTVLLTSEVTKPSLTRNLAVSPGIRNTL